MTHARRPHVILLTVGLAVLCLLGQVAAIAPAWAENPSAATPAGEIRQETGYSAGSAPANDGFGSAIVIGAVPYTNTQSVEGATTATDDPAFSCWPGVGPKNRTVWYRYTAPSAQTLIVDTLGSSYDTVLGVWTGSQGSLVNVGCNDDAAPGFSHSRMEFAGSAGTTYYIEAADWNNPSATSQLTLNLTATGPGGFVKTAPVNGATGLPANPTLSWGAASGASFYEYCYDTTNDNTCNPGWVSTGTATSASLTGLGPNTYYWQVRASNGSATTYADGGIWWSFTTSGPVLLEASFRSLGTYDGWVLESGEAASAGGSLDADGRHGARGGRRLRPPVPQHPALQYLGLARRCGDHRGHPQDQEAGLRRHQPADTHGFLIIDAKTGAFRDNPASSRTRTSKPPAARAMLGGS